MEFLEGRGLYALLQRGSLPPQHAVDLTLDWLGGVKFLHRRGILHGDLTPGNLFVTNDGRGRLIDLALAFPSYANFGQMGPKIGGVPIYRGGVGKYLAPERLTGGGWAWSRIGYPSDLFSMGKILYEAVTGKSYLPISGHSAALFQMRTIRPLRDLVPTGGTDFQLGLDSLWRIIEKSIRVDQEERFQTAEEMIRALRVWRQKFGSLFSRPLPIVRD
jgi:serine/threonine protein kinase